MVLRAVIILCEGETERIYFESVKRNKRVTKVLPVEVFGKQGQHRALIKKCVEKRKEIAREFGFQEDEIEVWAVCDRDNLKEGYLKLKRFADKNNVKLAFSDPQFETYLVQHFEFKKITKKQEDLESELSRYIGEEYNKTDLGWLDDMIDMEPAKLDFAIQNSEHLSNHTKSPFLTVQKLTARLLELAR